MHAYFKFELFDDGVCVCARARVRLSVCLPACLSVFPSVRPSVCLCHSSAQGDMAPLYVRTLFVRKNIGQVRRPAPPPALPRLRASDAATRDVPPRGPSREASGSAMACRRRTHAAGERSRVRPVRFAL